MSNITKELSFEEIFQILKQNDLIKKIIADAKCIKLKVEAEAKEMEGSNHFMTKLNIINRMQMQDK